VKFGQINDQVLKVANL